MAIAERDGGGIAATIGPMPRSGRSKKAADYALAGVILLATLPLLLFIAGLVRWTSPGPAIYRQLRVGQHGRIIEIYKFRTMYADQCDDGRSRDFRQAGPDDSRVTPIGRLLRRTGLDELPQFVNVLRGEMSIVGPRPHPLALHERYAASVPRYVERYRVKPGVTGWAQVNGLRGETETVEKMAERVRYDLEYIENPSRLLDLKIILRTARIVVTSI